MANRDKVTLTWSERDQLTEQTRSDNSTAAKFVHSRALLLRDAGKYGDSVEGGGRGIGLGLTSRTI